QLIGKGIQADTRNLHIESVQDTETYQSKQQNGNVQVTVGYGFSASGSYRQSKVKADHASVTGQSGIYAGEDGYQIKVGNHTDLKGGIITSGKSAEDKGKNLFQTATLTASDIQNHSRYEGKSFGIGGSFDLNGGWDGTVTDKQGRPTDRISLAAGYGSDSDSQSSITKSGINTRNIHITDEAGQLARTGRTAKETEARIYTGIDTETADQHTGRLKNSFDKDAVAKEINLQREVTKEFGRNAAQAVAAVADKLGNTQSYERYQEARTLLEAELQNTDSEAEKAAFRASLGQVNAYLAENQSRYDTWKEGGIGRSILHGAAGGLTTGSLGGILAGGGTSLAAPYLDKAAENLGPAGKAAVNALGGAAIGYATGGSGGAVVGANVDWNNRQLHPKEMALADKYAEALKREVEKREGRKISSQEAAMRIRRQILRWVDKGSQDGYTDQSVISLIGMKGEDKALGYTWDYRDYGARNPQTYNDPKLFEEYRRQDKPEYRNLTWLHSGTKDTKIRQGERKNEEFALNVAEGLTSLVNPNPRIKVPILAGIRNLKNIKPTVTGSDPLLAGAGNIRIPATSNVAKVDRIPDTALASKSHQKNDFGTSKGQGAESSIPVPQAISIKIKNPDKTVSETTYQSNPKHTPGQLGFKFDAGIEPKNSVQLIESSVQIGKQRFAIDDKGHIHRYMGGDRKNEPWHWAGSTSDKKNPLSLTSQQKAGIKRAYPEQSKNKLLK
ncbi:TPA: hemagglutinin repeat-containing protein, partial [Neisseria meningitidis]